MSDFYDHRDNWYRIELDLNEHKNASHIMKEEHSIPVSATIDDVDTTIGYKWYRKWSNGYIEQGGYINAYSSATREYPIEFATKFTSTDYTIFTQESVSSVNGSIQTWSPLERFDVRTVSGTTVYFNYAQLVDSSGMPLARLSWNACGF